MSADEPKSSEKEKIETPEQRQPSQSQHPPRHPNPIAVSEPELPTAPADHNQASHHKEDRFSKTKLILEILTVFGIYGYGYVAFLQWGEMRGTVTQMQEAGKQTDKLLEQVTNQSKAARDNADAAKKTIEIAQENIRLDQRAWVGIKGGILKGEIKQGQKLSFVVEFQNTGRTPALDVIATTGYNFIYPTKQRVMSGRSQDLSGGSVASPNFTFTISRDFSEKDVQRLENKEAIFVYGMITYRDIFNNKHTTYFCTYYDGQAHPNFSFCRTLNHMD